MSNKKYFKENLIGKKFGKLLILDVIEQSNSISRDGIFICNCDCGNKNAQIKARNVLENKFCSCGCEGDKYKFHKKYNKYDLSGEYGIGYTLKNEEFYFDLEDYDLIKEYCWCLHDGYVNARDIDSDINIKFHRLIFNLIKEKTPFIDHKNGIKNDNRKQNLRKCNQSQNRMNSYYHPNITSGITGIIFSKEHNKYRSRITVNKKTIHLGYFYNLENAIIARKEAEEKYFGEYSYSNSRGI